MLPLWCDQLQIVLTPDHVTIARQRAGFTSSQIVTNTMPCAASTPGEPAWQPAIRALQSLLKQKKINKANASVLLSNHFVRYQLISAQPDVNGFDEEQAFVRFSFAEVYGSEVNRWQLRWGANLQVAPQVASAIDIALIEQIESSLSQASVKLVSMQPYLMAAFNYVRKSIDTNPHWFVLVEPSNACVGFMQAGEWQQLQSNRLGADWATDCPRILARELQMAGSIGEQSPMIICLPSKIDVKNFVPSGHSLRVLTMTPEALMQSGAKPLTTQLVTTQSVTTHSAATIPVKAQSVVAMDNK